MAGTLRAEATLALANALFLAFLLLGGIIVPVDQLPDPLATAQRAPAGERPRRGVPCRARAAASADLGRPLVVVGGLGGRGDRRRRSGRSAGSKAAVRDRNRFSETRRHTLSSTTTAAAPQPRRPWTSEDSSSGARRGDHDAFAELVGAAVARLDAAARLILRDPELARDAVQDALIRAWRDLPGLRDPDRFDAWLHRLTVNACLDTARRRRRRPIEVELTPSTPRRSDIVGDVVDRELLDRGAAAARARLARGRRPALLPGDAAARGGGRPGHPIGHGEVAAPSLARACMRISVGVDGRARAGHRRNGRTARMSPIDRFERRSADRLADLGDERASRLRHRPPRADRPYPAAARLGDPRKVVPNDACHQQPADRRPRHGPRRGDPRRRLRTQPLRRRTSALRRRQVPARAPRRTRARCLCRARSSAAGLPRSATRRSHRDRSLRSSSARLTAIRRTRFRDR